MVIYLLQIPSGILRGVFWSGDGGILVRTRSTPSARGGIVGALVGRFSGARTYPYTGHDMKDIGEYLIHHDIDDWCW
jgi:hypothetical protein